jgi:hypothetical protein
MGYRHVQKGYFHLVLLAFAGLLLVLGTTVVAEESPAIGLTIVGGVMTVFSLSFMHLTVSDGGDVLRVRFGPIPFMRCRIRYDAIRSVAVGRSSVVDGWGVHWLPGRGWIWNLWGLDCVVLDVDGKRLRVGTDDPEGLATFLTGRASGADAWASAADSLG